MDRERALQEYTATSVETGSPVRLVAMLYEGALRFLHEAESAIDQRNFPVKAEKINRAMRIVQELGNALDEEASPELVERLRALYEHVEHEILQASTFNDPRHLHHAARVLTRLHAAWRELADRNVLAPAEEGARHADLAVPPPRIEVPTAPPAAPTPWSAQADETARERVPSLSLSA